VSTKRGMLAVGMAMLPGLAGCDQSSARAGVESPTSAQSSAAEKPAPAPTEPPEASETSGGKAPGDASASEVKRIVFIDKERCCACTRRAIDATWAALQEGLGQDGKLPVERVHLDTQAAQAGKYRAKRALVTAPAIYFLDEADGVVELLQGEVTLEEVRTVLDR